MGAGISEVESSQPSSRLTPLRGKNRFLGNPAYLLLTTAGAIFVSEVLIMVVLQFLPRMASFQEAVLDALLLSCTIFPVLYFFVFKPLNQHIAQCRRGELEKDALIAELHKALDEVKTLRGIVPICGSCKKIRDDNGFWQQVEVYVGAHSDAMFSHGICPECAERLYPGFKERQGVKSNGGNGR